MSNDNYQKEIQALGLGAEVILFEIDMTSLGGPIEYMTPMAEPGQPGGQVSFGGQVYLPFPIAADGFEWSSQSAPAQPTVNIANVSHALTGYVLQYDSLIGAQFRRIKTFEKFLDTGSEPDGGAHMPIDVYRFERKVTHNDTLISWELASWIAQQGVQLPKRIVVRDYCDLRYRIFRNGQFDYSGATCPYTDAPSFDRLNEPVSDPADDVCSHNLQGCRARFGTRPLPFGGFPGVAKFRT